MSDLGVPVIVLCGGLGTRLRPAVADRPKVLADVGGRPFLDVILDRLAEENVGSVWLSVGHLADAFDAYLAARPDATPRVRCIREPSPLGTGGAIRFVYRRAALDGCVVVMNGDTYLTGVLSEMVDAHRSSRALATLASVRVDDASRYGTLDLDGDGRVLAFNEKRESAGAGWINAGWYVLEPEAIDRIPDDRPVSIERDVFPTMLARTLRAHRYPDATFLDIGTPEDYARAASIVGGRPERRRPTGGD